MYKDIFAFLFNWCWVIILLNMRLVSACLFLLVSLISNMLNTRSSSQTQMRNYTLTSMGGKLTCLSLKWHSINFFLLTFV
jgi:hypothetical protein